MEALTGLAEELEVNILASNPDTCSSISPVAHSSFNQNICKVSLPNSFRLVGLPRKDRWVVVGNWCLHLDGPKTHILAQPGRVRRQDARTRDTQVQDAMTLAVHIHLFAFAISPDDWFAAPSVVVRRNERVEDISRCRDNILQLWWIRKTTVHTTQASRSFTGDSLATGKLLARALSPSMKSSLPVSILNYIIHFAFILKQNSVMSNWFKHNFNSKRLARPPTHPASVHSIGVAQRTHERVAQMLKELQAQVRRVSRYRDRWPIPRSVMHPAWLSVVCAIAVHDFKVESRKVLRAKLMSDVQRLWELLQVRPKIEKRNVVPKSDQVHKWAVCIRAKWLAKSATLTHAICR